MGCCGLTVELIDEALTVELGPAIVGSGGGSRIGGLGHGLGHAARHALEHDGEGAGFFKRTGVVEERSGGFLGLALHLEAAEGVHRLRSQAQMPHHRDGAHLRADFAPALELHGVRAAFLQKAAGVAHRVFNAHLVGEEGHVAYDECMRGSARDRAAVVNHIFHGN